jgi:Domain of unknown function (DUF4157)
MSWFSDVVNGVVGVATAPILVVIDLHKQAAQDAANAAAAAGGDVGNAVATVLGTTAEALEEAKQAGVKALQSATTAQVALLMLQVANPQGAKEAMDESYKLFVEAAVAGASAAAAPYSAVVQLTRNAGGDGASLLRGYVAGQLLQINILPFALKRLGKLDATPDEVAAAITTAPLEVVLASALEASVQALEVDSKPLPPIIRKALGSYFGPELLKRARYRTQAFGITLPEAINGFQAFMGEHSFAVTTGHIIHFSVEPGTDETGTHWWAHELAHVQQFSDWGIDGFAEMYVKDYGSVEAAADERATQVSAALAAE